MDIKTIEDKIIIERKPLLEKTAGGVILPASFEQTPMEGTVISVGPGKRNKKGKIEPMTLKVGDKVLFGSWAAKEMTLPGKDYVIMIEDDIIGILR